MRVVALGQAVCERGASPFIAASPAASRQEYAAGPELRGRARVGACVFVSKGGSAARGCREKSVCVCVCVCAYDGESPSTTAGGF